MDRETGPKGRSSWWSVFRHFLLTADPDLHYNAFMRSPVTDLYFLEAHGERILDLLIRLASDSVWCWWLMSSVEVAVSAANLTVFDQLLATCPRNSEFWTQKFSRNLLGKAAEGGNFDIFSSLRNVCPSNSEFWTHPTAWSLLHYAARGGNVEIFSDVYTLIRSDSECWTEVIPMHGLLRCAATGGNVEIFSTCLARCPNGEAWTRENGFSLLCGAGSGGSFQIVEIFSTCLARCPNGGAWTRENGFSLLCGAGSGGSFQMWSHVLAIDGFPSLLGGELDRKHSRRLLDNTASGGSVDILLALLEVDDILSIVREVGGPHDRPWSALDIAAHNGHRSCVKALIEAGAPLEYRSRVQGSLGDTALSRAVQRGHAEVVRELLAAGASIFNTTESFPTGQNLLSVAANANRRAGVIDDLVAAGADLGKDRGDKLPLHLAAKRGVCRSLERLLLAGAKVDCVDGEGRSALHVACFNNREDAVEILLRHHANPLLLCDEGLSPFDVVAKSVLERRQRRAMGSRFNPCTLNVVETSVADRIYDLLRSASRWGRRGWLVVLRARHLDATPVLASMSLPSLSARTCKEGHTESLHDGLAPANTDHDCAPGGHCSEQRESTVPDIPAQDGDGIGGGQGRDIHWKGAVMWLLQRPAECGVFREILSFL